MTSNDLLTVIAAWIGTITGSLALGIQFVAYRLSKAKINCELDSTYDSYWVSGVKLNKYDLKNTDETIKSIINHGDIVVLSLSISNKTNSPITVESVRSNQADITDELDIPILTKSLPKPLDKYYFGLVHAKPLQFPYRLNSNDVIKCAIFILVDSNNMELHKIKLTVKTPAFKKNFKFKIKSFDDVIGHKKIGEMKKTLSEATHDYDDNEARK
ncbi:hypothetical protein EFO90_09015 [Lactiplantibacillus plantarum]|uniref:hypothetical protein n=1 Tax=Lactiplantibacillus plantarum TaxID=1590 RepID=UPI0021A48D23|nr:hypothetical protein [Lactiplantibacillus plantarum]MCT3214499.1 hypothetical protein [Lactiplantibacillus plantarum]MCT3270710.1 hypothetical protein [Lactiplantibacillus plantarum]